MLMSKLHDLTLLHKVKLKVGLFHNIIVVISPQCHKFELIRTKWKNNHKKWKNGHKIVME